ncbi:MAG: GH36-type glycosyl hydrolase domain-containing protein, partial [Promethearchaeota archaeon]
MSKKAFGSGYFGEWIDDEFRLPAYRYTCDQIKDPKAMTPMNEQWRAKTEHLHQVGNDRIIGVASNYGHVQVRQDEGSPKYLNEFYPEQGQHAGGFGYLTDGNNFISTFYPGNADSFQRIFGIGYYRKKVIGNEYVVDQIIFAPFGDDPVLISQVEITNNRDNPVDLRWIEYWGSYIYQFSSSAFASILTGKPSKFPREIRHDFSNKFKHEFDVIPNRVGLVDNKFLEDLEEKFDPTYLKPTFIDNFPPKTFLVSLDGEADAFSTNGEAFFGEGGVKAPDGLNAYLTNDVDSTGNESAMLLERKIILNPGESRTLSFLYGYIPEGFELQSLISKYKKNLLKVFEESCQQWKNNRMELQIQEESWVNRELFWHYYYLRGAMTYDSFFKEHILSQGHVYQYIIGFQGAARDPLQHALPFIYSDPSIVKNVIRYTLKTTRKNGEIPFGITGSGQILPVPLKPSDQGLWLLWLVSEYILGTRDVEFLDEEISRYPCYGSRLEVVTVKEIIARCYKHITKKIGIGRHGLQRLSNGDWNDNVVFGHIPSEKHEEIQEVAESVLNAAMAIYVLRTYSNLLKFINEEEMAESVLNYSNSQREAVQSQWNGNWVKRAWLTEELGWIGDDQMWLEPQPWAIIGNALDDEQKLNLVNNINKLMREPSRIGALILNKGLKVQSPLGQGTNGGIWPSINGTLIWALSLVNGEMAWDEWKKNTLVYHADNYPDIWYGIWSGPDTYNSSLSKYPGQTGFNEAVLTEKVIPLDVEVNLGFETINWTDFPVFNLHPHAWPLYDITRLVGITFTPEGVELRPKLPQESFNFKSSLIGLEKTQNSFSGWYNPLKEGTWKVSLELTENELEKLDSILINGIETEISPLGNL